MMISIFLFGQIINAYISGGDYEDGTILFFLALVSFLTCFTIISLFLWILVQVVSEDLRYLVRFKILPMKGIEFSTSHFDPIEAVLQTLKGKESWIGLRRYKRESLDYNQLDFIRIYLRKKYQRDLFAAECLRFFSIGTMHIYKRGKRSANEVRYSFVMLDEKTGELLFCTNGHNEWPYVSEVLEESGLILFDISETVVDMEKHVINEDGSIETMLISS